MIDTAALRAKLHELPRPLCARMLIGAAIVKGIGNASNFYGRAVYYPNYGTRPPHNGREVRAAVTQLDATALSSLPLLQIDSLQIVWYSNEEHGQCL